MPKCTEKATFSKDTRLRVDMALIPAHSCWTCENTLTFSPHSQTITRLTAVEKRRGIDFSVRGSIVAVELFKADACSQDRGCLCALCCKARIDGLDSSLARVRSAAPQGHFQHILPDSFSLVYWPPNVPLSWVFTNTRHVLFIESAVC